MRLIAWDTSSKAGALVALEWEADSRGGWPDVRLAGEWTLNIDLKQSEQLLWGIDLLLKSVRWELNEIDVFGVGVGPGSFTGLRVGLTTARTLAHALGKPLIGVSSLAALARPAALWLTEAAKSALVIAATDACKGEFFALWGAIRSVASCAVAPEKGHRGLWVRGVREEVLSPQELILSVKKKLKSSKLHWLGIGEARARYPEIWEGLPGNRELKISVPFLNTVQGRYVGMLAWEAWQAGLAREALEVHPRYLRASDAEIKLKAGLLGRKL